MFTRQSALISGITFLFLFMQLSAGLVMNDSVFTSVAFAKKGDNDKDKDKDKGKKGLKHRVDALEQGLANIELTPGPQGEQGIQGVKGDTGNTGETGSAGTNGTNGADGAVGAAGADGTNGIDGAQGPVGSTGADGAVGAVGQQGPAGNDGADGVGDIKVVKVQLQPPFTSGTRDYDASSACNGQGHPIEAGILNNPYTDVSPSVAAIDPYEPKVGFQLIVDPNHGAATQVPIEFWVKCSVLTDRKSVV